jgi:Asp-tRNA(Asn)/Glu-tRNA(Gln) amidotransferase C subunit
MVDFLFHEVSEAEKEKIRKQAKEILDNFSKQLSRIDSGIKDSFSEREESERLEGKGNCEPIDREIMFENAPNKNRDFIVAEKGSWKK